MNTKIKFTYKDVPYTLEYDRSVVKQLENAGFNAQEFLKTPALSIELVFKGAFIKNHRNIKESLVDEIYKHMPKKEELVATMITMIQETYETLFEEPEESEGNIEWGIADLK